MDQADAADDMSIVYAAKRALRKTMQRKLNEISLDSVKQQCEPEGLLTQMSMTG